MMEDFKNTYNKPNTNTRLLVFNKSVLLETIGFSIDTDAFMNYSSNNLEERSLVQDNYNALGVQRQRDELYDEIINSAYWMTIDDYAQSNEVIRIQTIIIDKHFSQVTDVYESDISPYDNNITPAVKSHLTILHCIRDMITYRYGEDVDYTTPVLDEVNTKHAFIGNYIRFKFSYSLVDNTDSIEFTKGSIE